MHSKIKICGISTPGALDAAASGGADYMGLNFYAPSPRYVSPAEAAVLSQAAAGRIVTVGVFVDPDDTLLKSVLSAAKIDMVQLHGSETAERAAKIRTQFGLPVWKVLSIASSEDIDRAQVYAGAADFLLFDAKTPKGTLPGGMGLAFDWGLLKRYTGALPWGLAGGLMASNVAAAIRVTGAPLVDTSSGVESAPGIKDVDKIAAFCKAALQI